MSERVLLLRIEPTDYIRALVREVRYAWPGTVDVIYVNSALTQPWTFDAAADAASVLPAGLLRAVSAIRARIHGDTPALVHTAGWGSAASAAALLTARSCGLPTVVDLDTWDDAATGWRAAVKRKVLPCLLRQVSHFAPGGQRQAEFLKRYGVPSSRITPINMTVDVTAIRAALVAAPGAGRHFREKHGIGEGPLVLFLSRLVAEKGVEDLLAAWPLVAAQCTDARLAIAGDGPLADVVSDAAAADPSIRPVGRLAGEEVWHAYAAANLFVAPSRHEGWGLTVNEAMAAEVPILMTEAFGCLGDLATPDETVAVVPPGDPQCLAGTMVDLLVDAASRRRLAAAAARRIDDWTLEAEAARITAIWRRLIDRR